MLKPSEPHSPLKISPDIPEEELVKLARQQETQEEAFRLIVDRYSPMLYAVIRRVLITHDDTNDALQNTLIKVWKNLATSRVSPSSPPGCTPSHSMKLART